MPEPFQDLFAVDREIHEPARLAILTILEAVQSADFLFLSSATGIPNGNVSSHLFRLEAAGLVAITKSVRGRRSHTRVHLTAAGRTGIREYWRRVDAARSTADGWRILSMPAFAIA